VVSIVLKMELAKICKLAVSADLFLCTKGSLANSIHSQAPANFINGFWDYVKGKFNGIEEIIFVLRTGQAICEA
jgi:hypothetical protein